MDEALRALERAWEQDGSLAALRSLLQALTRAGRRAEVVKLVRAQGQDQLAALGAALVVDLEASPRYYRVAGEIKGFEQRLRAWRLTPDLGGLVFVESVVDYDRRKLVEVGPASKLVLTHYALGGVVTGEDSELRVDEEKVFHVAHREGPDDKPALEAALHALARTAGATLEITQSFRFCD